MYVSEFDGVLFVEGSVPGTKVIDHLNVKLNGAFSQAQLKTLDDVKRALVKKLRELGGNAILNFKYGQRSSFWVTLVGIDDVGWYGSGEAVLLSKDALENLSK